VLIGEASIRLDALADDLKRTINRDINEALAGVKIDNDPLVKMTQDLNKAELELVKAEDALSAAHRGTQETEAKLLDLRRSSTATTNEVTAAERALVRARAEESVVGDRVTTATQKLAAAHGALTKSQKDGEAANKSWTRSLFGSSSVLDSVASKLNIFGRRSKDAGDETTRTARKLRDSGADASGLGRVLDGVLGGALKFVSGQFSAMGDVGGGVFSVLTSKAVLIPAALAPLLGVVGGLIIALPALAAVGGVALGAILLGMDGIKRAFKPLSDDIDALKSKVSASFESALAPAVAKMPALFAAATTGLQSMATALGGTVTQLVNMLTTSENLAKIRDLFNQTAQFIQGMQPGIKAFTQGFLNLASAVAPQLRQLGEAIGSILGSIGDAFNRLQSLGLVKSAIDGLAQVFRSIGTLLGPILELFGRLAATLQGPLATVITAIANGLTAAMPGIQAFADEIGKAFTALAPALQAILPLVGQVAGLIGGVLGTAIATLAPPLTTLIQGLTAGLAPVLPAISKAFVDLGAALGPVLQQLAGALVNGLNQLLPIVPQLLGAITQLAPVFLQVVAAVIPLIPPLVQLVATILPGLIRLWLLIEKPQLDFALTVVNQVVPALLAFLSVVQKVVVGVVNFFTDFDTNVSKIWTNIVNFFQGIGDAIGGFFSGIGNKIVGWFQAGVDFLQALPGKVGDWLATLPGIVGNALLEAGKAMLNATIQGIEWVLAELIALPVQIVFALGFLATTLGTWVHDGFVAAVDAIIVGIANVVVFFHELPGKVLVAVSSFLSSFSAWWQSVWEGAKTAVATGIANVVVFFHDLPGRVLAAVGSLANQLFTWMSNSWNSAKNAAITGAENVISFVRGLPRRILDALGNFGNLLYDAGKNIIEGFIRGLKAAAGAVGGAISDILSKARKLLPFSPAKEGPFSGKGWSLYSGMSIMEAMADGLRIAGSQVIDQAVSIAAAVQGALSITPVIDTSALGIGATPSVPDLSGGATQAATAQAQLLALQALVTSLATQGKTLPADLAAALESLRVVVSAQEITSGVRTIDQQDSRRR
jgi:phage-related protein